MERDISLSYKYIRNPLIRVRFNYTEKISCLSYRPLTLSLGFIFWVYIVNQILDLTINTTREKKFNNLYKNIYNTSILDSQ